MAKAHAGHLRSVECRVHRVIMEEPICLSWWAMKFAPWLSPPQGWIKVARWEGVQESHGLAPITPHEHRNDLCLSEL